MLMGGSRRWWLLSSRCNEREEGSERGPGTSVLTVSGGCKGTAGAGVPWGGEAGPPNLGSKQPSWKHPTPRRRPRGPTPTLPAPYLGVSASEPRSSALCTSPVRLAICFSIASILSLPWGRERSRVRSWLRHHGHPQACPSLTHTHPPGPCKSREGRQGDGSTAVTSYIHPLHSLSLLASSYPQSLPSALHNLVFHYPSWHLYRHGDRAKPSSALPLPPQLHRRTTIRAAKFTSTGEFLPCPFLPRFRILSWSRGAEPRERAITGAGKQLRRTRGAGIAWLVDGAFHEDGGAGVLAEGLTDG